jgi:hypothetical protein
MGGGPAIGHHASTEPGLEERRANFVLERSAMVTGMHGAGDCANRYYE